MDYRIKGTLLAMLTCLVISCEGKKEPEDTTADVGKEQVLPFTKMELSDMSDFKPVADNWQIVGDVYVDQTKKRTFVSSPGTGILLNTPVKGMKENLFTNFEHGDIEIEFDVMMPIHSNSGMYFQGRYEIQLLDSWGKEEPQHSDIGGIYQRWDKTREKGERGFDGHAPRVNAAKAPGLWQHFKIIFHAPRFDDAGNKIKNASFEEVWLNGVLLHKDQELSGPTRSGAFEDEQPLGPLMIQGDHAAVALRNIKYKLFHGDKVSFSNITMTEYENELQTIPPYEELKEVRKISTDSVSSQLVSGQNPRKILDFEGTVNIPVSGEYLFEMRVNLAGGKFDIDGKSVIDLDGDFDYDDVRYQELKLEKGQYPFSLVYNKHRPYRLGFELFVEGPGIQKHALHAPRSYVPARGPSDRIYLQVEEEPVMQRSFLVHKDEKRTHCISVGTPRKIHYSYDLAFGSLLQAWGGDYLEVTKMWVARGAQQLGEPLGVPLVRHTHPDFAFLKNEKTAWPDSIPSDTEYRQLGYTLDTKGAPTFRLKLNESLVENKFMPSDSLRSLNRIISIETGEEMWHKLAEGSIIEALPNDSYAIDDKSYFLDFSGNDGFTPMVRKSENKQELLVKIPQGNQKITYKITW
nr:family 16 glycoside hydrolase [Allomuricauda sp.]